jgi:hypothetical protein
MNQGPDSNNSLVVSYLVLRKAIGIIGLALPFVLAIGACLLQRRGIQCSVSAYYYTAVGNVFVGSLSAIGVFLMSYRGYEEDRIAGRLASGFAIGTALFPTNPCQGTGSCIGCLHFTSAALLFLTLAYFSIFLFTKTDPSKEPTRQKRQRNIVYRACGYTMLACLFLIGVVKVMGYVHSPAFDALVERWKPEFWLESISIVSFGVSWLVKGETILKDEKA